MEYGGVYIAGSNTSDIIRYDPARGLDVFVHPEDIPAGAEGVASFCQADGDFFYLPANPDPGKTYTGSLYQLTSSGRIRQMNLPASLYDDVLGFGILVYFGKGRVMLETRPKGPFAIVDFIAGEIERSPVEFPPRGVLQTIVPDFSAEEIYLMRRAKDMSIYFLRYPFKGGYRGDEYILRTEFPAGAATFRDYHLFQYGSGKVDVYNFMFEKQRTIDLAELAVHKYTVMLGFMIVRGRAYVVGLKGPVGAPEGYDLLVFTVKGDE
jgi:hypothetical protein